MRFTNRFFGVMDQATGAEGASAGGGGGGGSTTAPSDVFAGTPEPSQNNGGSGDGSSTAQSGVQGGQQAGQQSGQQTQQGTQTQQGQQGAQTTQQGQATQQTQQQPTLTPQQIAELAAQTAARTAAQGQQGQGQQQKKAFTQEEYNRTFNVAQVSPQTFKEIMGFEPENPQQVVALNNFGQSVARQALTMASALLKHEVETLRGEFRGQLQPVSQHVRTQVETQMKNEFYTAHPHLKDFEGLIDTISQGIIQRGQKFPSKEAAFTFVAQEAARLLGKALPAQGTNGATQNGSGTQQGTPPNTQTTQRRMAPLSGGGQATAGNSSGATQSGPQAVFG